MINLKTKKNKAIKEKNIKNEITKYQISLNSEIEFNLLNFGKVYKENIIVMGDFLIGDNYSSTISNEKKLIDQLVEEISEEILDKINARLNDI